MTTPLELINVPYSDFKIQDIIDSEQFDLNNAEIQEKSNNALSFINKLIDHTTSDTTIGDLHGARLVGLEQITGYTSNTIYDFLVELTNQLKSTATGKGASTIGVEPISNISGTNVQTVLNTFKSLIYTNMDNIASAKLSITDLYSKSDATNQRVSTLENENVTQGGRLSDLEYNVTGTVVPRTFEELGIQNYTFDQIKLGYIDHKFIPLQEKVDQASSDADKVNTYSSRIDNLVAQSGTSNTEIVDARQKEDGITYTTLRGRLANTDEQLVQNTSDLQGRGINALYPPIPYVAAKGDGVTDDSQAIQNLLNNFSGVILLGTTFRSANNIRVPQGKTLKSGSEATGGNATLLFDVGFGLISDGRYTVIKNLTLSTPTTGGNGIGVLFSNSTGGTNLQNHFVTLKNLIMNNFGTGIKTDTNNYLWNCAFEDIRMNNITTGIQLVSSNYTNFGLRFKRVYMNGVTQLLNLSGTEAVFDSCNFGLRSVNAVVTQSVCDVTFRGCNFECDMHVAGSGTIFSLASRSARFEQCGFPINVDASVTVFSVFSGMYLLSFEDCNYKSITGNLLTDFFDKNGSNTGQLFAIKFKGNTSSIPRPNYYNAQMSNFIDQDNNLLPAYNTSVDKTKMKPGMMFWHTSLKKPVFYDGTSIYDFTGAVITT